MINSILLNIQEDLMNQALQECGLDELSPCENGDLMNQGPAKMEKASTEILFLYNLSKLFCKARI